MASCAAQNYSLPSPMDGLRPPDNTPIIDGHASKSRPLLPGADLSPTRLVPKDQARPRKGSMEMENRKSLSQRLEEHDGHGESVAIPPPATKTRSFMSRAAPWILVSALGLVGALVGVMLSNNTNTQTPVGTSQQDTSVDPIQARAMLWKDGLTWLRLYQEMGGAYWISVYSTAASLSCPNGASWDAFPCGCSYQSGNTEASITCDPTGQYIWDIVLLNNNVVGSISSSNLNALSQLKLIDVSRGAILVGDGKWLGCIDVPKCGITGDVQCLLPMKQCYYTPLGAWRALMSATSGMYTWTDCRDTFDDPCSCSHVTCEFDPWTGFPRAILSMDMRGMQLRGYVPSQALMAGIGLVDSEGFTLDLSSNTNVKGDDYNSFRCVDMPPCESGYWQCTMPATVLYCRTQSDVGSWLSLWNQTIAVSATTPATHIGACTHDDPCACDSNILCQAKCFTNLDLTGYDMHGVITDPYTFQRLTSLQTFSLAKNPNLFLDPQWQCIVAPSVCTINGGPVTCMPGDWLPFCPPGVLPTQPTSSPTVALMPTLQPTDMTKQPHTKRPSSVSPTTTTSGAPSSSWLAPMEHITKQTSVPAAVHPDDLAAWQAFYTATGGTNWVRCNTLLSNPCDCTGSAIQVTCVQDQGFLRITALNMPDNRIRGVVSPLQLYAFPALIGPLIFSSAKAQSPVSNSFQVELPTNPPIPNLQACLYLRFTCAPSTCNFQKAGGALPCASGAEVPPTFAPTMPPTSAQPTHRPTSASPTTAVPTTPKPTLQPTLHPTTANPTTATPSTSPTTSQPSTSPTITLPTYGLDVDSFNLLQVALSGWIDCATPRDRLDPCNRCPTRVVCERFVDNTQLRIVRLNLTSNGLIGTPPSAAELFGRGGLSRLSVLDLSENPYLLNPPQSACLYYAECQYDLTCLARLSGEFMFCGPRTSSPTPNPPLEADDLANWQVFYDSLNGQTWTRCSNSRNNPCDDQCGLPWVRCGMCDTGQRILQIRLPNSNLYGELPVGAVANLLALDVLDVSNAVGNAGSPNVLTNPTSVCYALTKCWGPAACDFDGTTFSVCPPGSDPTTTSPTGSITTSVALRYVDQLAWWALYDSTNGPGWVICSDLRNDPCACVAGVLCEEHQELGPPYFWVITAIRLPSNNLYGWYPDQALQTLSELLMLDLGNAGQVVGGGPNTANVALNTQCLNIQRCYEPLATCKLSGLGAIAVLCPQYTMAPTNMHSPTYQPTVNPTPIQLYPTDLLAWQSFYDGAGGSQWLECSQARNDPCNLCNPGTLSTHHVTCVLYAGYWRLNEIKLVDNNLRGNLQDSAVSTMNFLNLFDVSSTLAAGPGTRNVFFNVHCAEINRCFDPSLSCSLYGTGAVLCPYVPVTGSPTQSAAPTTLAPTTLSPTTRPTMPINLGDLAAWQLIFDQTQGTRWMSCTTSRMNPCDPSTNGCDGLARRIVCDTVGDQLRIVEIVLPNNNVRGPLNSDAMTALDQLVFFDVSTNIQQIIIGANVIQYPPCVNCQRCYSGNMYCNFKGSGGVLCPMATISPTTLAPTTLNPTTQAPTTRQPTKLPTSLPTMKPSSLSPTSMSPTMKPSQEPVSSGPTTHPSLSEPSAHPTQRPTTARPTTLNPTIKPTTQPTSLSPTTAQPTTSQPTTLQPTTAHPTSAHPSSQPTTVHPTTPNPTTAQPVTHSPTTVTPTTGTPTTATPTTTAPTLPPTSHAPTVTPPLADLAAWQAFYDFAMGTHWVSCSTLRNDPCSCRDAVTNNYVLCGLAGPSSSGRRALGAAAAAANAPRILEIVLNDNNMKGVVLTSAIASMDALQVFQVASLPGSTTPNTFSNVLCVQLQQCYSPMMMCDLSGTGVNLCPSLPPTGSPSMPTQSPTVPTVLLASDMTAFSEFYYLTNGLNWQFCRDAITNPCNATTCGDFFAHHIVCGVIDGDLRLVELKLPQNNLRGTLSSEVLASLSGLMVFDVASVSTQPNPNIFYNPTCVSLPRCNTPEMACNTQGTGAVICPPPPPSQSPVTKSPTLLPSAHPTSKPATRKPTAPTASPVSSKPSHSPSHSLPTRAPVTFTPSSIPTSTPSARPVTMAPSRAPLVPVMNVVDLAAWRTFYDALTGPSWLSCTTSRDAPCDYMHNGCALVSIALRHIECTVINNEFRIVGIVLVDNAMVGRVPTDALNLMTALETLDLSGNVFFNDQCLNLPFCYDSEALCRFDNTGVQLCPPTPPPTGMPTVPGTINPDDLDAWKILFDVTAGSTSWVRCREARFDPCGSCPSSVNCTIINGSLRITTLFLRRNGLNGDIPFDALNALSALTHLDVSNLPLPLLTYGVGKSNFVAAVSEAGSTTCLLVEACLMRGVQCLSNSTGMSFCTSVPGAPTSGPTTGSGLELRDLVAWQWFYDDANGAQWESCADTRSNPCSCNVVGLVSVTCVGGRITQILLPQNILRGAIHAEPLRFLMIRGLVQFDVSNPIDASARRSNILTAVAPETCLDLPMCYDFGVYCVTARSGVDLCPPPPPSIAPTTVFPTSQPSDTPPTSTNKPTGRPTIRPTMTTTISPTGVRTVSPSSRSPSLTNAPTFEPSHATTTPTSNSPTTTSHPTTSVPTSAAPTTASPTLRPTTSAVPTTASPTLRPSTSVPTSVAPTTASPTLRPSTSNPTNKHTTPNPTSLPTTSPTTLPPSTKHPDHEYETHAPSHIEYESQAPTPREYEYETHPPTQGEYETRAPAHGEYEYEHHVITVQPSLAPVTQSPTTANPTTRKPTIKGATIKPTTATPTGKPTTNAPSTSQPTTRTPSSSSPTTTKPTTTSPTSTSPTTVAPTTGKPTSTSPTSVTPTTSTPTTTSPTATTNPTTTSPTSLTPTTSTSNTTTTTTTPTTVSPSSSRSPTTLAPATNKTGKPESTAIPTIVPTSGATLVPTLFLVMEDLAAFHSFYDSLGGANWVLCAEFRNFPCECATTDVYVKCEEPLGRRRQLQSTGTARITSIHMPNNGMSGVLPVTALTDMGGLETVDLAGNSGIAMPDGSSCASIPVCQSGGCTMPSNLPLCTSVPTTASPGSVSGESNSNSGLQQTNQIVTIAIPVIVCVLLIGGVFAVFYLHHRYPDRLPDTVNHVLDRVDPSPVRRPPQHQQEAVSTFVVESIPPVTDAEQQQVARTSSGRSHFTLLRDGVANESLRENASLTAAKEGALMLDVAAKKDADDVPHLLTNIGLQELWPRFEQEGNYTTLAKLQHLAWNTNQFDDVMSDTLRLKIGERIKLRRALDVRKGDGAPDPVFGNGA